VWVVSSAHVSINSSGGMAIDHQQELVQLGPQGPMRPRAPAQAQPSPCGGPSFEQECPTNEVEWHSRGLGPHQVMASMTKGAGPCFGVCAENTLDPCLCTPRMEDYDFEEVPGLQQVMKS
jgi:hypothetical protein